MSLKKLTQNRSFRCIPSGKVRCNLGQIQNEKHNPYTYNLPMRVTIEFLFFQMFFVSLLMGGLCYFTSRRLKAPELFHLVEFWASLGVMTVVSYIFRYGSEAMVAISMLGWIWPAKTIFQVMIDVFEVKLKSRSWTIVLSVGGFITLALAGYGQSFRVFTAPFCLAYCFAGLWYLWAIHRNRTKTLSILGLSIFALMCLFFITRGTWFLWRLSDLTAYVLSIHLVTLIGLAASTLAYYMEEIKMRHEQELMNVIKERNDQLFEQSKYSELGMMTAGIAHEINNPLAIIQAKSTQLLRLNKDPKNAQKVSEGLEQILYTSDRIARTVRGVRDFVHQEDHVPNERISIKSLVDDVLAFCGQRMKNHGVNLRFYGLENYYVRGHRIQLEQVLLNLLNNSFDAIEFLPDKWIELSVHETSDTIQMYFKDSGPGIPPEVASRMMEPFYTTKQLGKGTGLGLALSRGIMEKHGGSLVYLSNARHTTFMLELPKDGASLYQAPNQNFQGPEIQTH